MPNNKKRNEKYQQGPEEQMDRTKNEKGQRLNTSSSIDWQGGKENQHTRDQLRSDRSGKRDKNR